MADTQLDLMSWSPPHHSTERLRPYQHAAVEACLSALEDGGSPVLALPTGSGKSRVIAALCEQLPGRILVATHRQELLEQNAAQLQAYQETAEHGIFSAGLKRREVDHPVIFGGIQSIYRQMNRLQQAGTFHTVIVDEAHRVPPPSVRSMYGQVFEACPGAQRIGLTATPYRLDEGLLHEGDDTWFDCMPVYVGIRDLTPEWLAPLAGILTAHDIDVSQVRTRAGEFVTSDLSQAACEEEVVRGAVEELCRLAASRRKWLVFCVDVAHTRLVGLALAERGIRTAVLLGETPQEERKALLESFRAGKIQALVNCEVATTGFDIPDIDCVVLLRPTQSKALVVQMLGRGTRQAPAKVDCLVLDFAGNLARHTPLDELYTLEKSPDLQAAEAEEEDKRQAEARARAARHLARASLRDPMEAPAAPPVATYRVSQVSYQVRTSQNPKYAGKQMLMVRYFCPERLPQRTVAMFLCVEYHGWAREQALAWFQRRHLPAPTTALHAMRLAQGCTTPTQIVVREETPWPRILMEHFEEPAEKILAQEAFFGRTPQW